MACVVSKGVQQAMAAKFGAEVSQTLVERVQSMEAGRGKAALVQILTAKTPEMAQAIVSEDRCTEKAGGSMVVSAEDVNLSNTRLAKHGGKGQFQCRACGKWNTEFSEKQMRSGDEPSTLFVRCNEPGCRKRWTVNG